ncbi:MAG: hypothetical protein M3680_18865 [Myxococcota bacterium]|nr:hypothetical protein [Myxococcota bacterium]
MAACSKGGGGSTDLSFGKPAEPFGVLAKVKFGEPDTETVKAVPGVEYKGYVGRWRPNAKTEVELTSADVTRHNSKIEVRFEDKSKDELIKAWGPGKEGKDVLDQPTTYYFNGDGTIRAQVDTVEGVPGFKVEFLPMLPLAKLVSDDATAVGGVKLLGANPEEVSKAASQAGYAPEKTKLKAPLTEWNATHTMVTYEATGGAVTAYTVFLDTKLSPTAKDEILDALEAKWGKPTPAKSVVGDDELVYKAEGPRIALRSSGDSLYLEVKQ